MTGWCVADTGASFEDLQKFIDYGCSKFNCDPIQFFGECYEPNVVYAHASWVLDKYYRQTAICQKNLGFITTTNPCKFLNYLHIYFNYFFLCLSFTLLILVDISLMQCSTRSLSLSMSKIAAIIRRINSLF